MNSDQYCPKCKKNIPSSNFLLHISRCERFSESKMDIAPEVVSTAQSETSMPVDDSEWVCTFCTLKNKDSDYVCDACSNQRPGARKPDQPVTETLLNDSINPSSWEDVGGDDNGTPAWLQGMMLGAAGMGLSAVSRNRPMLQDVLIGGLVGATVGSLLSSRPNNQPRPVVHPTESRAAPPTNRAFVSWTTTTVSSDGTRQTIVTSSSSNANTQTSMPYLTSRVEDFDMDSLPLFLFRRSIGLHNDANLNHILQSRGIDGSSSFEEMMMRLGMPRPVAGSRADINGLETREFAEADGKEMCVVCQDDIVVGRRIKKLKCGHVFHSECVDEWLQRNGSCPTCKRRIDE